METKQDLEKAIFEKQSKQRMSSSEMIPLYVESAQSKADGEYSKKAGSSFSKYIVMDGNMMINKRTCKVLGHSCYEKKFYVNFMFFIEDKITLYERMVLHALNDIDILDT